MVQSDGMAEFVGSNYAQVKAAITGCGAIFIKAEVFPAVVEHHVKFNDNTGSSVIPGVGNRNGATTLCFPEKDNVLIILSLLGHRSGASDSQVKNRLPAAGPAVYLRVGAG